MRDPWIAGALAAAVGLVAPAASGAECSRQSAPHAVALLELYTSEGCNSCPPADQWFSGIARGGPSSDQVIPLALHVDYWDRLGWKDRFADARYTDRQLALARAAGSRAVYTPGVFLNLQEFRGWSSPERFREALRAVNAKPAGADILLELETPAVGQLNVKVSFKLKAGAASGAPRAFVALYENRLRTEVGAGENRGVTLHHDYVVRAWIGPIPVVGAAEVSRALALGRDWKAKDLGVAAFVQDSASREVLQATALAVCSPT